MNFVRARVVRFGAALLVGGLVLAASWSRTPAVTAQCKAGEYILCQVAPVGWVYVNADRTAEWWAYFDGEYRWADQGAVVDDPWQLQAQYVGATNYGSFCAWKASVRQRAAAQGKRIIFQQHWVQEEVVQN